MRRVNLSAYRAMWLIAMFDLPVETKENRRRLCALSQIPAQRRFYDVAVFRLCALHSQRGSRRGSPQDRQSAIPPLGQVRVVALTDHQFAKMEVFYGRKPREPEEPPAQFMLF